MKLILKAKIASYPDPILEFFHNNGFLITDLEDLGESGNWCIERNGISEGDREACASYFMYSNHQPSWEEADDWGTGSLLANTLIDHIQELVREINHVDQSKLPDLVDAYLKYENILYDERTPEDDGER